MKMTFNIGFQKERKIILVSGDGKKLKISLKAALKSKVLSSLISNCEDKKNNICEIPVPNVLFKSLENIIRYCKHHKKETGVFDPEEKIRGAPKNNKDGDTRRAVCVTRWDYDFLKSFDQEHFFQLMKDAHYLKIEPLVYLCCKYVAYTMDSDKAQEIWEYFNSLNTCEQKQTYTV